MLHIVFWSRQFSSKFSLEMFAPLLRENHVEIIRRSLLQWENSPRNVDRGDVHCPGERSMERGMTLSIKHHLLLCNRDFETK